MLFSVIAYIFSQSWSNDQNSQQFIFHYNVFFIYTTDCFKPFFDLLLDQFMFLPTLRCSFLSVYILLQCFTYTFFLSTYLQKGRFFSIFYCHIVLRLIQASVCKLGNLECGLMQIGEHLSAKGRSFVPTMHHCPGLCTWLSHAYSPLIGPGQSPFHRHSSYSTFQQYSMYFQGRSFSSCMCEFWIDFVSEFASDWARTGPDLTLNPLLFG